MKKFMILLALLPLIFFSAITVKADATWEKNFSDDFENYAAGKVETQTDFTDVWTNDLWSGTNPKATDINDVATIKSEDGNRFLNIDYDSSFFYMAPKTIRAMEFEIEFDFRSHDLDNAWVGVNMRKEFRDTRYNGSTGMMFYFKTQYVKDVDDNVIGESIAVQALRGGSLSTTDLNDQFIGNTVVQYLYPTEGEIDSAKQIMDNWYNVRIVVSNTENAKEALYEVYIDDTYMASITYSRSSLNIYGYFSLNACTGNFDVDNFSIQSNDTVAPSPKVYVNKLIDASGQLGEEITLPGGEDGDLLLVGDDDDVVEIQIIDPEQTSYTLDAGVFKFTPDKAGVYTVKYIVNSELGGQGSEEYYISIQEEQTTDTQTTQPITTEPTVTTAPDTTETGGNGGFPTGIVLGIVGGVIVIAAGVLVVLKFKK